MQPTGLRTSVQILNEFEVLLFHLMRKRRCMSNALFKSLQLIVSSSLFRLALLILRCSGVQAPIVLWAHEIIFGQAALHAVAEVIDALVALQPSIDGLAAMSDFLQSLIAQLLDELLIREGW